MSNKHPKQNCLIGAGFMGHTWAVTARGQSGDEVLRAQASSGPDAANIFKNYTDALHIYCRKDKQWKKVSLGYAAAASH